MVELGMKLLTAFFEFLSAVFGNGFTIVAKRIHYIYNRLSDSVDDEKIGLQRAIILRIHNGGGNLSSSRPTYASVLYEESRKPLHQIRQSFQNVPADKHLMRLLQELRISGDITISVNELPEDAYLKYFYTTQKIKHVRLLFIKQTKGGFFWSQIKEMYLLCLSTTHDNVDLNSPAANELFTRLRSDIKRNL